jgi:hypothetical protein
MDPAPDHFAYDWIDVPIVLSDADRRMRRCNAAFARHWGQASAALRGQPLADVLSMDGRGRAALANAMSPRQAPRPLDLDATDAAGGCWPLRLSWRPRPDGWVITGCTWSASMARWHPMPSCACRWFGTATRRVGLATRTERSVAGLVLPLLADGGFSRGPASEQCNLDADADDGCHVGHRRIGSRC